MPDPLATVLRIRKRALDEAAQALAACVATEQDCRQRVQDAGAAIGAEGEVAADLAAPDGAVEAFARWLPVGRAALAAAQLRMDDASADTMRARAALTLARAAAEAAEALQERRAAEQAVDAGRRAQAVLDEIGLRPGAEAGRG